MTRSQRQPVVGVGVSGSAASEAALVWAAREARNRGGRLRVIQAWQPRPLRALYASAGQASGTPPSRAAAARSLAAAVVAVLGDAVPPDLITEVVEGPAERVLADVSAQVDVLVLGSGGQSPVAQVDPLVVDRPVGPVVRACLSHARCPVVIITPPLAPVLTGARQGDSGESPGTARRPVAARA